MKIGDGGTPTENFTTIAEVMDIEGPGISLATAEVTNQSSPGGFREKIGTVKDGGQITFSINYVTTEGTHDPSTGLLKDLIDKTKRNFKLVFPDTGATEWLLPCLVVNVTPSLPVDGALTAAITLEVAGQPTLA